FQAPGRAVWSGGVLSVTAGGLQTAGYVIVPLPMMVSSVFLLTYTTSPMTLTDALERVMGPLKKIKAPVHEFAMMMTIALRFIPTLIEETEKIMSAQRARGADFESGRLVRRARALAPLLVPLFVSAIRRADELAVAMECRCYNGGDGRTRLRVLRVAPRDFAAAGVTVLTAGAVITLSVLGAP
ncbi:MAG: energy-coupling factor transporter transmembrane protein EcfT, partial [Oscillospiraceae bacterium]|nr:energy-coupling factor transporter transmembrane protein EcfT [Oscillospiraceae bacterium]